MYGLNVEPFEFQLEAIDYALKHKYSINAYDMGLGKSLIAIAVANNLRAKTLIVCPAFLKYGWQAEINKFCDTPKSTSVFKFPQQILGHPAELDDFIIINYEQLLYAEELFKWADFVVVDEAHCLKSLKAQRTILFDTYLYNEEPANLLLLTGTPIQNRVEELYSLLSFMAYDPSESNGKKISDLCDNFYEFCDTFSHKRRVYIKGRTVIKWEGLKNEALLKSFLEDKFIRKLQQDVHTLPEMFEKEVIIKHTDDKKLASAWDSFNLNNSKTDSSSKRKSAEAKAGFTAKYVKALLVEESSCVVFSDHREPVKAIYEALNKLKKNTCAMIMGDTPMHKRHEYVKDFQAGKINVIIATIGAASVGLTLTKAQHIVFNDISWVSGDNAQARKRIHRIGQDKECFIHYIMGSNQDRYITNLLRKKMRVINRVVEDDNGSGERGTIQSSEGAKPSSDRRSRLYQGQRRSRTRL
jgi:SNF2 family DNA or RNA helicase